MNEKLKLAIVTLVGLAIVIGAGCSAQTRAKHLGGTYTTALPPGRKLMNVTWKEDTLWILTRSMYATDLAETYEFNEHSPLNIVEGKVIIKETPPYK